MIVRANDITFLIFGISVFLIDFPPQFWKMNLAFFSVGKFGDDTNNFSHQFRLFRRGGHAIPAVPNATSWTLQYTFLASRLAATGLRTLSLKFALGHFARSNPSRPLLPRARDFSQLAHSPWTQKMISHYLMFFLQTQQRSHETLATMRTKTYWSYEYIVQGCQRCRWPSRHHDRQWGSTRRGWSSRRHLRWGRGSCQSMSRSSHSSGKCRFAGQWVRRLVGSFNLSRSEQIWYGGLWGKKDVRTSLCISAPCHATSRHNALSMVLIVGGHHDRCVKSNAVVNGVDCVNDARALAAMAMAEANPSRRWEASLQLTCNQCWMAF